MYCQDMKFSIKPVLYMEVISIVVSFIYGVSIKRGFTIILLYYKLMIVLYCIVLNCIVLIVLYCTVYCTVYCIVYYIILYCTVGDRV